MNQFFGLIAMACLIAGAIAQPAAANVDCNNPPQSDPDKCCATPKFFNDEMVGSCETAIKTKGNNVTSECIGNCLLSKSSVVAATGSIKKDELTAFLIKQTGDAVWNKAITTAVNICVEDGAKRADELSKAAKSNGCGALSLYTVDCVYMQLFKNCPKGKWSSSKWNFDHSCEDKLI